jgi:uncharacterized protein (DUF1015 family)
MATLHPFRALRPSRENAVRVAAPPYDVVSTAEARALARGNPDSYLHVSRPEIDLPEGTDEHSEAVYAKGAEALADFRRRGVLRPDAEPRVYVYAQRMGSHRQAGIVACASVEEYDADLVKKHEKTRADKEDDRTRHIDAMGAHDEPVFLTYRAVPAIDAAVVEVMRGAPEFETTTADGVEHRLWMASDEATRQVVGLFRPVPALYVADGHHRSAAASRVHALRKGQPGEHGAFLAVVFPHDQMQILAYNRLVRHPGGASLPQIRSALEKVLDLSPTDRPEPEAPLSFGVYLDGRWWRARVRPGSFDPKDPVASLDCSILQDQVLARIFYVRDPRRDRHVDFVGGIRGAKELERRVKEERWDVAFHLFPTRIEQLLAVSDAGLLMPPKSTWFEPKLRSGLFVHVF